MGMVMPKVSRLAMLAAWIAAETTGAKVRLFTNELVPDDDTVIDDLTVPEGDWYTEPNAVYGQVYEVEEGGLEVDCTSVQFNYSGTDAAEVIKGYAVIVPGVDDDPDELLQVVALAEPVTMANALDSIVVRPTLVIPRILS